MNVDHIVDVANFQLDSPTGDGLVEKDRTFFNRDLLTKTLTESMNEHW